MTTGLYEITAYERSSNFTRHVAASNIEDAIRVYKKLLYPDAKIISITYKGILTIDDQKKKAGV